MPKPEFSLPPFSHVRDSVRKILDGGAPKASSLNDALRLLAKYRSHVIQWEMARLYGGRVQHGPFAGMSFLDHGSHIPKLLGCYEHELHPFFEAAIGSGYEDVVNIGCAEGYYAVGLALRMPGARIHAFDTDPRARQLCAEVAARNGVAERVQIGERFGPDRFEEFAGRRAFFLIDIEGDELDLLGKLPREALRDFDLIIECHDAPGRPVSAPLAAGLAATHLVGLVTHRFAAPELPPPFAQMGDLDRLLAVWEWREHPTPWLAAAARGRADGAFARLVASGPAAGYRAG
jgi:SAM-dependent methyltransferase